MKFLLSRRSVQLITCLFVFAFSAPAAWANVYFPQVAAGGGYVTVVTLMHTDARSIAAGVPVIGRLKFYNPDGTPRTVTSAELGSSSDFAITLPYQGTRVITITAPGGVAIGTAVFEITDVSVGGVARFTFAGASVGVIDAKPTITAFVPLTTKSGFSNGIAVQNPGATPINVRLRLIKPDGTIDQTSSPAGLNPLPPFGQFSRLVGAEMGFNNPVQANSTMEIAVQGAGAAAVLPLVISSNGYISSAGVINRDLDSPLFFAQVVDGGGYSTAFRIYNPSELAATGFLRFFSTTGAPRQLPIAGLGTVSFIPLSIGPGRTVVYETTGESASLSIGAARIDSLVTIGALATIFFGQTHVGVPAASVMRSGRIPVDTDGGDTGVALTTSGPDIVSLRLTLQNRDGGQNQIVSPPELSPLRVNQQYARYVTQMGFSGASGLKDSSLLIEPSSPGTFIPLALLDRGAFSSTATSRQRLYNPQQLAGTYTGGWRLPDFLVTGSATITLAVDSGNNATLTLSIGGGSFPQVSGKFNADGELIVNGVTSYGQLIDARVHADGTFSILLVNLTNDAISPIGLIAWSSYFGELAPPRAAGTIMLGHLNGTLTSGSFSLLK